MDQFLGLYNYWIVIFLMMTGFYIVIARENLIKTIIGLNIFQTSVFLLYITMGKVTEGTAPIIRNGGGHHEEEHGAAEHVGHAALGREVELGHSVSDVSAIQHASYLENTNPPASPPLDGLADATATSGALEQNTHIVAEYQGVIYSNPLPSVLMLTAIVVGIATTALALALIVRIREEYGTIEEDEIIELDRNS
ncbi:MAG: NADH-quinone oxidoreductase subunit K [Mariniblastus sp.]|nr:NADH-quinone oxidoreductase subunit K [Mariniblastus sp.]